MGRCVVGSAALVVCGLLAAGPAVGQGAEVELQGIVTPELAVSLGTGAPTLRPGVRVEVLHPSALAGYGTFGVHSVDASAGGGAVVDLVAGVNYRPDLGLLPLRLYVGAGYGVLQYQNRGALEPLVDVHGGVDLMLGRVGARLELRRFVEPRSRGFDGPALVLGVLVKI